MARAARCCKRDTNHTPVCLTLAGQLAGFETGNQPASNLAISRHYRDRDGFEVDVVLERGSTAVAGIEVKAAASVNEADFRGLRKLREAAGQRFTAGVVLYDGPATTPFGDDLFAIPVRRLWEE